MSRQEGIAAGRTGLIGLLLGLMLSAGLGSVVAPAQAAPYCNIYPPSRVAIWGESQTFTYTFGAGCEVSGAAAASWRAAYPDSEEGRYVAEASWERGRDLTGSDTVWQWQRKGRVQWTPVGSDPGLIQNQAWTTIKFGAVSYIAARRTGGYHEVTARAYHYTPGTVVGGIAPSGGRPGQVQFRTPGSSTWRPVAGVRLERDGRVIIRTWSPGARYYRVSFGEQPTLFDTISGEVHAR